MALFLTIHTRYTDVQLGLFKNETLLDWNCNENKKVSKNFIAMVNTLLTNHALSLSSLDFIAAHQGPAPFTTLRVSLASVNGLAFATHIPLIGVNGLEVLLHEHKNRHEVTIALLNAFCSDVYYGIFDPKTETITIGYGTAETVIQTQAQIYPTVTFIGNGTELYASLITKYFGTRAHIPIPLPEIASLTALSKAALKKWHEHVPAEKQLMPLYIKGYSAVLSC